MSIEQKARDSLVGWVRLQAVTHAVQQRLRIDCRECDKSPTLRPLSFPRRRESTFCAWVGMDSRLRGNDDEEALQAVLKPSFLGYFSAFSAQLLRFLRSLPHFLCALCVHSRFRITTPSRRFKPPQCPPPCLPAARCFLPPAHRGWRLRSPACG